MGRGVTSSIVADALGIHKRTVNKLADKGVLSFKRDGRGYKIFDLETAQAEYDAYTGEGQADDEDTDWNVEQKKADTRIKRARADMLELEREEMMGRYHRAEFVADAMNELIFATRSKLLALPGKLAPVLTPMDDQAEVSAAIKREIVATLDELATYTYQPTYYRDRLREELRKEPIDDGGGDA
jgi:excisionase family DNA binding protein